MKIMRFSSRNRTSIAVNDGDGWIDYGALLEFQGINLEILELEADRHLTHMLKWGLLERDYIRKSLNAVDSENDEFQLNEKVFKPLLPLRPGKIVCVARNWEDHAKEGGHDLPDNPVIFVKTENCAIGPNESIFAPSELGRVDHEGELGVIIGRKASRVKAKDAGKYIHSYTIVNDVTARAFQRKLAENGWPWYVAKSMDNSAPIGPWLVMPDEAEPLTGKRIRVTVNGEIRQDGSLDDMHWKIPELIEAITKYITLNVGDVISTGTPSGVGPITDGDTVEVKIDGIGTLTNPVSDPSKENC